MTRKDYIRIAAALMQARLDILGKELPSSHSDLLDGVNYAIEHVAATLAREPGTRFDRARFLKAAGFDAASEAKVYSPVRYTAVDHAPYSMLGGHGADWGTELKGYGKVDE